MPRVADAEFAGHRELARREIRCGIQDAERWIVLPEEEVRDRVTDLPHALHDAFRVPREGNG
jgi:hypothetical protein